MARVGSLAVRPGWLLVVSCAAGLLVLVLACAGDERSSEASRPARAGADPEGTGRPGYLDDEAGTMADEDARQVQPAAPPGEQRRRPEPIQERPARPVDQPRLR